MNLLTFYKNFVHLVAWGPVSCNPTRRDFFLRGFVKSKVYKNKPHWSNQAEGRNHASDGWPICRLRNLEWLMSDWRVIRNLMDRSIAWRARRGGYNMSGFIHKFQNLLNTMVCDFFPWPIVSVIEFTKCSLFPEHHLLGQLSFLN